MVTTNVQSREEKGWQYLDQNKTRCNNLSGKLGSNRVLCLGEQQTSEDSYPIDSEQNSQKMWESGLERYIHCIVMTVPCAPNPRHYEPMTRLQNPQKLQKY